ncbi:MAG: hypothetical protein RIR97_45 [Pseudomonadota bacterium]
MVFRSQWFHAALAAWCLSPVFVLADDVPPAPEKLASHRAVYDISLKSASERSGIKNLTGRMVYEFVRDGCSSYTMNFRYVTRLETGDGAKLTDQQSVTTEDLSAKRFDFDTKSLTDNNLDKEVKGIAIRNDKGLIVAPDTIDGKSIKLESALFPTEHMIEVIKHAKKGEKFFESRIFDGSEDADKSILANTIIGPLTEPDPESSGPDVEKADNLGKKPFWPVSIAYFDGMPGKDELPSYTMTFKLYDNGITRNLEMNYGEFILTGNLYSLEVLPESECPAAK